MEEENGMRMILISEASERPNDDDFQNVGNKTNELNVEPDGQSVAVHSNIEKEFHYRSNLFGYRGNLRV